MRKAWILSIVLILMTLLIYIVKGPVPSSTSFAQASNAPSPNVAPAPASLAGKTYGDTPQEFGTVDGIDHWLPASEFRPRDSTTTFAEDPPTGYTYRTSTAGEVWFIAPLRLPDGAFLSGIRLYFRDTNATSDVSLWLCLQQGDTSPTETCTNLVTTSGTPGYGSSFGSWGATVDQRQSSNTVDTSYVVYVGLGAGDSSNQFKGVRAFWFRQVSPAPATASFTDVPTSHPFFQYIEALKASGVTAGCTATTYCPSDPLTRGQMAVFLARLVGLHFSAFYP